jgi:hypothetical protein
MNLTACVYIRIWPNYFGLQLRDYLPLGRFNPARRCRLLQLALVASIRGLNDIGPP